MSFWQSVQAASWPVGYYHWLALSFVVAAFALAALVPQERVRIRRSVLLFALSFVGLLIAGALYLPGFDYAHQNAGYRWVDWVALFIEAVAITTVASVLLFDVMLGAIHLTPPRILRDLLIALAYIIIAISLLSRSGVDLTGIVATSAVITAVIGFSLQDTLGNIMGGMALQMERTISVGDWVRMPDQQEGRVTEIRWRQTSIETRNWDTIVIPNSVLMKGQVTLLGRRAGAPRQHRQWVYFNVDFRHSTTEVIDVVEKALQAEPIPNVALEPAPHCLVVDFK